MSTRRLEEILEECLSAYLEGRRSVEESLSLYPSFALDLEPLLRTATSFNSTLNANPPAAHVQQRGLNRFLSDARARNNMKSLKVSGVQAGRFSIIWQKYRLGFAGAGMAVLILASSITGTALVGDGGDSSVQNFETTRATPSAVLNFQAALQNVKDKGSSVNSSDLARLRQAAQDLQNISQEDIEPVRDSISEQLADANDVVTNIVNTNPGVAPEAEQAGEIIRNVAAVIASPTLTATPAAESPTPEPTAVVTEAPTPEPTAEPTPTTAPTDDPMPTLPPPTEPPPRAPAAFAP